MKQLEREKLEAYKSLLLKWNKKISLISTSTEGDIWARHIMDSHQLVGFLDASQPVLDLGSGNGCPGLVLSIAGIPHVECVEADNRKCAFLREVKRQLNLNVKIIESRIESVTKNDYTQIVARGLCNLNQLLDLSAGLMKQGGRLVLLKGVSVDLEILEALKNWDFEYTKNTSRTHSEACILEVNNISRR